MWKRTLHVADVELPRELEGLYELAYNLWWTWTPAARDLFAAIDEDTWARYRNPVQLLINLEPRHAYQLLERDDFMHRYEEVLHAFHAYLAGGAETFYARRGAPLPGPIAYVSAEYGLHQSLAIYSGGLGVLSGDHLKSASDLGLPLVAVGLLYRHGYFQQTVDRRGVQQHVYPEYDFTRLPLRPLAAATGRPRMISVPFPGRQVKAQLWLAEVGRIPLVLLDADVPENHPADRAITGQLYVSGRRMRLAQEILLGIGGVRALRALGIEPAAWHVNEGHSALLQLERLAEALAAGMSPQEARRRVAAGAVFTTHTPVAAGHERFDRELVRAYLADWCAASGVGVDEVLELGRADGDERFNLTALAIRLSRVQNGVSRLNARVASDMWRHLYPAGAGEEPIRAITNGVHLPSWLGPEMRRLLERRLGDDWLERLRQDAAADALRALPAGELWRAHRAQKARLGRFVRARLREQRARHGRSPEALRATDAIFDEDALTIGFARRFATYKRAGLVLADEERLDALLHRDGRPLQLIFAGKAHPADGDGQALVKRIVDLAHKPRFAGKILFLEGYDMRMARMLVQGCDVWLNTPRKPYEASGTSGMKAAVNGVLNCSILDGWWPEAWNGRNGWAIDGGEHDGEEAQDRADAEALYRLLADDVLPLYFDRDGDGLPRRWLAMMAEAIATVAWPFNAERMVLDYLEQTYLPAAE
ncbi:MAG: alpha-glucan family phosphorylase [Acidobacteria bacterium]|nr:MAG: alpha-glucan family phosphorylase [Acidobacteriota bacterium]